MRYVTTLDSNTQGYIVKKIAIHEHICVAAVYPCPCSWICMITVNISKFIACNLDSIIVPGIYPVDRPFNKNSEAKKRTGYPQVVKPVFTNSDIHNTACPSKRQEGTCPPEIDPTNHSVKPIVSNHDLCRCDIVASLHCHCNARCRISRNFHPFNPNGIARQ